MTKTADAPVSDDIFQVCRYIVGTPFYFSVWVQPSVLYFCCQEVTYDISKHIFPL